MSVLGGEENYIVAIYRKFTAAGGLTENPLAPVPKDGVSKPFGRSESNPCMIALACLGHANPQERAVQPLSTREDPLKFLLGFDGLHETSLNGKALAALGTTAGENVAAGLGCHTGAETMGRSALPLVWLIRTLHFYSSRLGYYVKEC